MARVTRIAGTQIPDGDAIPVEVLAGALAGTQYGEGETDASITGTAIMWEDTGNTLQPVSAATPLPVQQAALDRTVDNVGVALQTDALMNDTTALTPKFAVIDAASSGDNTILVAVASKKIRVLSLFVVAAGAVVVRFESGAGGTALTGQMNLAANGGFVLPFNPLGWFETASNTLLNMELGGAVSVDGSLCYVEV